MRIQFFSDLHTELGKFRFDKIVKRSNVVALLGDIGQAQSDIYLRTVTKFSELFEHVLIIAGNHEFYHKTSGYNLLLDHLSIDMSFPRQNVHFLENCHYDLECDNEKVRFVGATLWSNIPTVIHDTIRNKMNDYRQIRVFDPSLNAQHSYKAFRPLTPADTTRFHVETVDYFDTVFRDNTNNTNTIPPIDKVVVLTHHLPLQSLIHAKYERYSDVNCCYATDLQEKIKYWKQHQLVAWLHGHTHCATDMTFEGVRFASNPHGYPMEQDTGFEYDRYIDV